MQSLWHFIKIIFKFSWRLLCFIRDLILNITFILFFVIIAIAYQFFSNDSRYHIPQDGLLVVNLAGQLVEEPRNNSPIKILSNELLNKSDPKQQDNSLFDVVERIRYAQNDPNITGMLLQLDNFVGGSKPALDYVAKAIREFKKSGKPVYAYGTNYTQSQYFLASNANKVYLAPQGSVSITGLSTNNLYYHDFLDNIKAKSYIYRVGLYKSAVEPFTRNDMSPEARSNALRWLNNMWLSYLTEVSKNRKITPEILSPDIEELYKKMQKVAGNSTSYALKNKLVDQVIRLSDLNALLLKQFGLREESNSYKYVSIYDYQIPEQQSKRNKIAVIFVNGVITSGESDDNIAGDVTIVDQIQNARLDKDVKAVILRVNSPGGSVTASEQIRNALVALRETGKPLIISMGGVAASGGYWISTAADRIIAAPDTITGSIGIFGLITTFEHSLNSIGIHVDGVSTSPLANVNLLKDVPESVSKILQLQIESGYASFLQLVAESRDKTTSEIDKIAQGQVWIGSDAKLNGLVDTIGDFDEAVNEAAKLAKLKKDNYQIIWSNRQLTITGMLLNSLNTNVQSTVKNTITSFVPMSWLKTISSIEKQNVITTHPDPKNQYIYCLECGYSY